MTGTDKTYKMKVENCMYFCFYNKTKYLLLLLLLLLNNKDIVSNLVGFHSS
jgi:hypothetical protein